MGEGELAWEGRRYPARLYSVILIVSVGVLLVGAFIGWRYYDLPIQWSYTILLVIGVVFYILVFGTSYADISVELEDDELVLEVKEHVASKVVRQKAKRIERDRIAKIVERRVGSMDLVIVEDIDGRVLFKIPGFLDSEEHDQMISAVMEWGNQPSSSSSSGSEEVPLADSR